MARAKADWKMVRKEVEAALRVQRTRLEEALTHQRRWEAGAWRIYLADHPLLMGHLVTHLLWGAWARRGPLQFCFRVAADRTLADLDDEEISLEGHPVKIGLVHPLDLSPEALQSWSTIFGEYELTPPFAQLDRRVFGVEQEEPEQKDVLSYMDTSIEQTGWLRGHLKRRQWVAGRRGQLLDFYYKPFPNHHLTAFIELGPGMNPASSKEDEPQHIRAVSFCRRSNLERPCRQRMALREVPAHVFSEVRHDLAHWLS